MGEPAGTLTTAEAVEEMAGKCREEAEVVAQYNEETARVIRQVTERFERVVRQHAPDWISLSTLERTRGWSRQTLRKRARELANEGRARKNEAGRWEIRRDAALEIRVKDSHQRDEIAVGDLESTAERLAREE